MLKLKGIEPQRVFYYFEQISSVPRGSEDQWGISRYCRNFAVNHNLKYIKDDSNNVVIFKPATAGYEDSQPVILQGHLDMVCQKTPDSTFDFTEQGIDLYVDGDFIKAKDTTLGADNGIAVAMILAILESDSISHPPIEAVFTTDEEIGMVGALALDMSVLKGSRMINLDAEEDYCVTVSCAGGSDLKITVPAEYVKMNGTQITVTVKGLKGGHSGVEINSGRENANILAGRLLCSLKESFDFNIISVNGGDKSNAIPNLCTVALCTKDADVFISAAQRLASELKEEFKNTEGSLTFDILVNGAGEFDVFTDDISQKLVHTLSKVPNGVMEMSGDIEGLVETSLNLGILVTEKDKIVLHFALRSNKQAKLVALENEIVEFFKEIQWTAETFGHYPPWEYKEDSVLRQVYLEVYGDVFGKVPSVEAIHAGLECGVFAREIKDFDCIAIGPSLFDVHTVNEKLSISSTEKMYNLLLKILEKLR